MKLLRLSVGRAIDHTREEKKKPFTVPSGPTILLTCEKIIVGSPDFFDLYITTLLQVFSFQVPVRIHL